MWWWLGLAIASEVLGTVALKWSDGFTRLWPVVVVVAGYAFSFFALSQALVRGMDLGAAYAIWSAIGLSVISVIGVVVFRESLSPVQVVGLGLVVAGITALQLGGTHG